jgi:hypothetical protein
MNDIRTDPNDPSVMQLHFPKAGVYARFDSIDLCEVEKYKWQITRVGEGGKGQLMVRAYENGKMGRYLHRLIAGPNASKKMRLKGRQNGNPYLNCTRAALPTLPVTPPTTTTATTTTTTTTLPVVVAPTPSSTSKAPAAPVLFHAYDYHLLDCVRWANKHISHILYPTQIAITKCVGNNLRYNRVSSEKQKKSAIKAFKTAIKFSYEPTTAAPFKGYTPSKEYIEIC